MKVQEHHSLFCLLHWFNAHRYSIHCLTDCCQSWARELITTACLIVASAEHHCLTDCCQSWALGVVASWDVVVVVAVAES